MKYQFILSLILLVLLTSIVPLAQALNDDPALKLYFTFDEGEGNKAEDQSQSGLKGLLMDGAKFVKDGKFGGAVEFGAAECKVVVDAAKELDITKEVTMAAWIFPLENQNDSNVIGLRTAGNAGGYCMQWSGFGNAAKIETWIGLPGWKGTRDIQKIAPKLKEWHHVVAIYDGKMIKQYIDGKLDASVAGGGDIASQDVAFHVGQAQTGLPSMFGKIDEVAVYDRALDPDEIKSDMENGVYFAVDPKGKLATTWAHLKK
mgnify:CR=1 FL=1